jgi:hypothetical protein
VKTFALALALAFAVPAGAQTAEAPPKAPAKAAPAPKLDELLAQWKRSPGLYAKFRDEKHLAMLDAPLVSEGTIHFAPPQRLSRRTETPIASVLVIDGNKLSFGDANGAESMDLGTNPVARLFVDSFVKLLEGDRAGLEKMFRVDLAGRPGGGWKMTLVPRIAPMDKVIKEMVIFGLGSGTGAGTALSEMDVRETSGDWTHTVFTAVDVNRKYTAAEIERLFRPPGKR